MHAHTRKVFAALFEVRVHGTTHLRRVYLSRTAFFAARILARTAFAVGVLVAKPVTFGTITTRPLASITFA
jgi:hypothetical protein